MIQLLNIALAGGLAAAAAPILIHLAHRRQVKTVDWGAMRFLQDLMARNRRRLLLDQWLLLLVRVMALLLLVLALLRPVWIPGTDPAKLKPVLPRGNRVAAVLLIDDSASTGSGTDDAMLERMKRLALEYVDSLHRGEKGSEVSILRRSQLLSPAPDPLYDLDAAKAIIRDITPTDSGSDMPSLMEAGLAQFQRHVNPVQELVLITDGRHQGWRLSDRARWADIQRRLAVDEPESEAPLKRPRLLVLCPEPDASEDNLSLANLTLDRSPVAVDLPVGVRCSLQHRGDKPPQGVLLRLLVDGRVVAERPLELKAGIGKEITIEHTFSEPGSHVVEAVLEGARDNLARDDRRALAVTVSRQLPVLLVEGTPGESIDGSLGILSLALDPQGKGADLFQLQRIAATDLTSRDLAGQRVVILGDVPVLSSEVVQAIERHVALGGGLLVSVGPNTDPELVNRFWARGGDGFLPMPLDQRHEPPSAAQPAHAEAGRHPAFRAFTGRAGEAWKAGGIRAFYALNTEAVDDEGVSTLLTLNTGHPLLVERRRGEGRAMLYASSLNLAWGDFSVQPAFIPLMRGTVGYLGSRLFPPRNLSPGDHLVVDATDRQPTVHGPDGQPVQMISGQWQERQVYLSEEPIRNAGVYRAQIPGREPLHYAAALPPEESRLELIDEGERALALGRARPIVVEEEGRLADLVDPGSSRTEELWRKLLLGAVLMLFVESLITRHQAVTDRGRLSVAEG